MIFIRCDKEHLQQVIDFYALVVRHLEATVNYPKWSDDHPSEASIIASVDRGEQYICLDDDGWVIGAVVLSENPEGRYEKGEWSRKLEQGEYLVIHVLAVDPTCAHRGVGSFMVEQCLKTAEQAGYKAVRLDVVPDNTPASGLYRKMGFQYAGTKDIQRFIDLIPLFDLYEFNL